MKDGYTFTDGVWHRVIQIVQEAMLSGVDCADLLRQIRVCGTSGDPTVLELTPDYQRQVREMHEKMLDHARELQAQQVGNRFIVSDGSSGDN